MRDLHPQGGKSIKMKACFLWYGGSWANIKELFCVRLIPWWGGLGMPVSSKTWKLSSGCSFLRRGLCFIPWHFWEGRKVWSGWFCNDSFLAAVFFSAFLALQKALPVLRSDPVRTLVAEQSPFVKQASYFCLPWKVPFRTAEPLFGLFRIEPWRNPNRNRSKPRPSASFAWRGKANPIQDEILPAGYLRTAVGSSPTWLLSPWPPSQEPESWGSRPFCAEKQEEGMALGEAWFWLDFKGPCVSLQNLMDVQGSWMEMGHRWYLCPET